MRKGSLCKEKGRGREEHSTPRDAIEWFVEIDARPKADETTRARWKRWMMNRANCVEYAEVAWLHCEAKVLPPPSCATREELLEDVAAEAALVSK
jgi:ferric-dicitrate binding protein FerR (iron transport regulator)